jgi:ATP-dependent RNA helicase DDX49/DBP8
MLVDSTGSSSDTPYAEVYTGRTRKRQKLSSPESDESDGLPAKISTLSTSRIKSRVEQAQSNGPPGIEGSIISNGKVVDAKSSFASLDVVPWLIASLAAMEILRPTAIQKGCIPEILAGRDVIGGSRTGSGKTVAFAVPILQKWAEDPMGIFAVVLTPTR